MRRSSCGRALLVALAVLFSAPRLLALEAPGNGSIPGAGSLPEAAHRKRVVVLQPQDERALAATNRLSGELTGGGLEVVAVVSEQNADQRLRLRSAALHGDAIAAVEVVLKTGSEAEVWLYDRLGERFVILQIDAGQDEGGLAPTILAVRALELLRANLAELRLRDEPGKTKPVTTPSRAPPTQTSGENTAPLSVFSLAGGVALLQGVRPARTDIAPALRMFLPVRPLLAGLGATGLGTKGEATGAAGSVSWSQWLFDAELLVPIRMTDSLVLAGGAGGGALYLRVTGESAHASYRGMDANAFSVTCHAALTTALRLGRRLSVMASGRALLASPELVVRFGPETTALSRFTLRFDAAVLVDLL